jgi:hypothetical protein
MKFFENKKNIKSFFIFVIYLFLCFNHNVCNAIIVEQTKHISYVIKYVLNEIQPYQVSIIMQNYKFERLRKNYLIDVNSIIKQISIIKPVIIIQSSTLEDVGVFLNSKRPLLQNARYTTLFLSLLHVNFEYQDSINLMKFHFKQNIKFIMNLSSNIRPICLFIVNIHKKIETKSINSMLRYAWKKRFLEITILQLLSDGNTCENNFLMNTYNPFTNIYSVSCFFKGITVFLNKLKKMNKYSFKVALIVQPPAVNFDRDFADNPININGSDYGSLLITSEYLNFSINIISPNVTSYSESLGNTGVTLLDLIIKGEIDFGANQVFMYLDIGNHSGKRRSEHSYVIWLDEVIALVPIFPSSLWIQFNALYIIVGITAQVSLMYLIVRICKFNIEYWRPHYIFQLLLGNTIPRLPRRLIEKLFFVILFIMSHQYSINWYAKLADKNLNELDSGPYESIKDLDNADIIFETDHQYAKIIFYDKNDTIGRLYKKVKLVADLLNCPTRVLENHKIGCLIDKSVASASIVRSTHNQSPKMKILNYVFWTGPKGYIFSEASPYVIEFDKINQRLIDAGLWMKWEIDNQKNIDKNYALFFSENNTKIFDQFLGMKLMAILISGFVISCIVFLIEIVVKIVQKYSKFIKRSRN